MSQNNVNSVVFSNIGNRSNQEDNFLFCGKYISPSEQKELKNSVYYFGESNGNVRFFAVSDGMGGHKAGEVASYMCVSKLAELEKTVQNCRNIKDVVRICQGEIANINSDVYKLSRAERDKSDMGATLVLLICCGNEYAVLNVGDSRAYLFDNTELTQITKDNTEGQRMLDLGLLTQEELKTFPARKNINRYIGYGETGFILKADEYYPTAADGLFLLCSDGLSDALTNDEILSILKEEHTPQDTSRIMVERALIKPNSDNTTVVIIPIMR